MNEMKVSPEWIQTSLAAAMSLGLEKGKFYRNAQCTCLNILLTYEEGCRAACSYCGLSRVSHAEVPTFIRVKWPTYSMDEILMQMQKHKHPFKRICISMITNVRAMADTCSIIARFQDTGLPISVLVSPTVMQGKADLLRLKEAGADHIGIAVDAATRKLFEQHRGKGVSGPHDWDQYWQLVSDCVELFGPSYTGIHLIVGLGETEEEMIKTIARANCIGASTHLFSFFPEAGSLLEDHPQPPMAQYRNVQLARYLINNDIIPASAISFLSNGEVSDYGTDVDSIISSGYPFMTSGCPGKDGKVACNRPYANERVNQPIRNFPFVLEPKDVATVRTQLVLGVESRG